MATNRVRRVPDVRGSLIVTSAFVLAVAGYLVFAPFFQLISPESQAASMVLRVLVVALCILSAAKARFRFSKKLMELHFAMFVFLLLYLLRLIENFWIQQYHWNFNPVVGFSIFIGSGLVPAFFLGQYVSKVSDSSLMRVQLVASIIFLSGVALNYDAIFSEVGYGQESLGKLNRIGLSWISTYFLLFFLVERPNGKAGRIVRFFLIVVFSVLALISQGRGPIIGTVFAILLMAILSGTRGLKAAAFSSMAVAIAVFIAPYTLGFDVWEVAAERFRYGSIEEDRSSLGRLIAWRSAWDQFGENPFFGRTVFESTLRRYPHNLLLEALISVGLVGTIVLGLHLLLSLLAAVSLLKSARRTEVDSFVSVLFFRELWQVQVSGAIWGNTAFWILSASVISLEIQRRRAIGSRKRHGNRLDQRESHEDIL